MSGATKELKYRIGADFGEVRREAQATGDATRKFLKELSDLEKKQRDHRRTLEDLGRGFLTFGAAMTAALGFAAKAAIDWETAFTGVRKTVDGSDQEIAALEGELRQLARTLPASHREIAAVAEAAGQLGIKRQDIAGFTKTMIDLGETTNLTADEAATALAKFSNIMGIPASAVDRLGSALVALGNDGASTEKDIIDMGLRIAGAGHQIGLTADEVLGMASALSSVGIEAEAGGTAISTTMIKIAQAANDGGSQLEAFANVAGLTADTFRQRFQGDASAAILAFIQGLARMQQQGQDVFGTLDELGLADVRVRDTLLRAAGASDVFTKSLQVGAKGYAENIALADEANKRYATSASKMQVAGNQIRDALIDVGAVVLPVVSSITQGAGDLVRAFQNLPAPLKEIVTWVGAAGGAIATLGGIGLIAAPKLMNFRDNMSKLVETGGGFSKALGKFGQFMAGPWGAAIGLGVVLLGALGVASGEAQRKQEELATAGRSVAQVIREQNGVLNEAVRQAAAKHAADLGLLGNARTLGVELTDVTDAILGQGNALDNLRPRLQGIMDAHKIMEGVEGAPGQQETVWSGRYDAEGQAAADLLGGLEKLSSAKNEDLQKTRDVDEASKNSVASQKALADEMGKTKQQAKEAADALNDLIKAMDAMNQTTLTVREAERGYVRQLDETAEVFKKNGAGLDIHTKKGMENSAALDAQAKAANALAEAVAREAEQNGGAAAGAAALQASLEASRPALLEQAKAFGMSEEEAKAYVDQVLAIPTTAPTLVTTPGSKEAQAELLRVQGLIRGIPPDKSVNVGVLSETAKKALQDIGYKVTTLPNGTVVVTGNTAPAQSDLDVFIKRNTGRRIGIYVDTLQGVRRVKNIEIAGAAHGGIVSFASGGMHENHSPQIVRANPGTVRVWAEPETGSESYIPWARDRRSRATSILAATADAFGYALVPQRGIAVATGQMGPSRSADNRNTSIVVQAGVVGSRTELLSWLAWATDELKRRGRI